MKAYENYKRTADNWLQEIPTNWELNRCCSYGRFATSSIDKKSNPDEAEINLVNFTDVFNSKSKWITAEIEFMRVTAPEKQIESNDLKAGDVLFTPSSEVISEIGLSAVVKEDLIDTCYSYHLLRYRLNPLGVKNLNKSYLRYLFNNEYFLSQLSSKATGTTRKILSLNNFRESRVVVPPLPEQCQIVAYLDYKTNQIDRFIANRKKQIELLEEQVASHINRVMSEGIKRNPEKQPTGIPYLPKIPVHWDLRKFIGLTKILTCGLASTPEYVNEEEGVPFLSAQNCRPFRMDLSNYNYIKPELHKQLTKYKKPEKGDVLVTRVGAGIGQACVIDTDLEFSVYVSLTHIRPTKEILSEYIVYFFNTEYSRQLNYEGTVVGGGQGNLNVNNVAKYKIPLPPIDEQREIVRYLDEKRQEIGELISKYQKQIDLMQEYKTSLISKAVTGKIDVREWQPKQPIKETV